MSLREPAPVTAPAPAATDGAARGWRAAWTAAHAPVAGVPRWARIAAWSVPFAVVPSGIWRILTVLFEYPGGEGGIPGWLGVWLYVILLSLLAELAAFATMGMIASWGEVFPRWVPRLNGRRVPPPAAAVPAALAALVLTVLWTTGAATDLAGVTLQGEPLPDSYPARQGGWQAAVFYLTYTPLLLWGPLLAMVTVAYWRRRRPARAAPGHTSASA